MRTLNIHEAKSQLSSVLQRIEKHGERYVICRNGKAVADLIPHQRRNRLETHPVLGQISIDYDPTEELTEDEWPGDL